MAPVARLVIQIDVPDDQCDPALTDPEDLADDIVGEYEDHVRASGGVPVRVVAAEWAT